MSPSPIQKHNLGSNLLYIPTTEFIPGMPETVFNLGNVVWFGLKDVHQGSGDFPSPLVQIIVSDQEEAESLWLSFSSLGSGV